jgi:transcriptional regulator with XRE-family HTH domain
MHPGEELKEIRSRLGITTREVAERSTKIAEQEKNTEFLISNSWLSQLETHPAALPSVHKLFTLACIYHVGYARLLSLYGIELQKIALYQDQMPIQKTHPIRVDASEVQTAVELPLRFDSGLNLNKTNLLSRMIEVWGQVPLEVLRRLDLRHRSYGFIGFDDYRMYPLLRPGSFVQIDPDVKTLQTGPFRTEFDRPIYFIDLRTEYACSWCELYEGKLLLVPHPLSPSKHRLFGFPNDAEIIGQVTGVAMRIAGLEDQLAGATSELSKRP